MLLYTVDSTMSTRRIMSLYYIIFDYVKREFYGIIMNMRMWLESEGGC